MRTMISTKNILVTLALLFLTVHLFGTHSRLLYHLNPDKQLQQSKTEIAPFSFLQFDENTISAMVFALAYSAMTAILLKLFDSTVKFFFIAVASFAILDFFGVLIYYNVEIEKFNTIGALYYAFYTLAIIGAIGYHRYHCPDALQTEIANKPHLNGHEIKNEILKLKEKNIPQKEIALQLNISESKVCRVLKAGS